MPELNWTATPIEFSCVICGTSSNDAGFVDFVSDTIAVERNWTGEAPLSAQVRICICAFCLRTASRYVGCASPDQVDEFARKEYELVTENEKLKDEIHAWQERFIGMANLNIEDFGKLAALEAANAPDPEPTPTEPT